MNIYPAIDLYQGAAVRLFKGDYSQMTIYDESPLTVAEAYKIQGSSSLHLVDLEGARDGKTTNLSAIKNIVEHVDLFVQLGGGIRDMKTAETYLDMGVDRLILGTAAITDPAFLKEAVRSYGSQIAVGIDIKEEKVAIKGWTELSTYTCDQFCQQMQELGVQTIICTDVSRDGAMKGTNRQLYRRLSQAYSLDIIASGGVSTLLDISALSAMGLHGAILGKALYTGAFTLEEALETAVATSASQNPLPEAERKEARR
ncbi:1-(5-phosphoribosyl)-5-[(5-phosphoribosylamino)methylideneamino]imidazole-4-carboxamide isomerase [Aminipila butyrica]|uniref:1-(5-phosphoribosyl)-5-[(5-phosphoribosylamino)methylideneamino] imidazole-4-carboxamide isomerase n=1 Tax=Aminipila butyrica TaxID=433296 RepID=A0A858BY42_9FIRM|nr:1-(5-phosphoribosyl)-5-[(5-phosphoribosylamino)methylideneamino]imidazole-4-carboxamide isomerase [Aminipila butyrica]QIB70028.1 1-(5-phosphoribosyl)-5-[(5-phosphoribosylamino)methylideneamino]imidazole-4-carboxamide isomerase [Aminipila butyrica]